MCVHVYTLTLKLHDEFMTRTKWGNIQLSILIRTNQICTSNGNANDTIVKLRSLSKVLNIAHSPHGQTFLPILSPLKVNGTPSGSAHMDTFTGSEPIYADYLKS